MDLFEQIVERQDVVPAFPGAELLFDVLHRRKFQGDSVEPDCFPEFVGKPERSGVKQFKDGFCRHSLDPLPDARRKR